MVKITELRRSKSGVTYGIEGRVTTEDLVEIEMVCESALENGLLPVLDLSALTLVERGALNGFRDLNNCRIRMINPSSFLAQQLKKGGTQ